MLIAANKITPTGNTNVSPAAKTGILKVLAYFDIFQYPLTLSEIRRYMCTHEDDGLMQYALEQLIADQTIYCHQGFYTLHNNSLLAYRRRENNRRANVLLPKALKIGRFLSKFPFITGVFISGSLSKNCADEKADIDFFIITRANRLWIARTIMHLFKKLTFVTGHQHFFCMNYYLDEEALLIGDQNIYTAFEIATLIPVAGKDASEHFFYANKWVARFFPAFYSRDLEIASSSKSWLKTLFEKMLPKPLANYLDLVLMNITTRRWNRKHQKGKRNKNGQAMRLITGRHFARSDPGSFQEKILRLYNQKLADLKLKDY